MNCWPVVSMGKLGLSPSNLLETTRLLPKMVTKHLFEIAWNVCGTRRKSIYDGDKVLGSVDFHSNSMNILFFHFTLFSPRDWGRLAKLNARKAI